MRSLRRRIRHEPAPEPSPWSRYRVAICIPMQDMCHSRFTASLVDLVAHTLTHAPGLSIIWLNFGTSIIAQSRTILAAQALERDATHTLWLDSDMVFPKDLVMRLLARGQAIVGANCVSRRPPFALTARIGDEQIQTTAESTGLQLVERVGTGVLLVNSEVFRKLELPWFFNKWIPEKGCFGGEDFYFCDKAREAGFEIHVDHDISKQVEHIGQFGLNPLMKAQLPEMEGTS